MSKRISVIEINTVLMYFFKLTSIPSWVMRPEEWHEEPLDLVRRGTRRGKDSKGANKRVSSKWVSLSLFFFSPAGILTTVRARASERAPKLSKRTPCLFKVDSHVVEQLWQRCLTASFLSGAKVLSKVENCAWCVFWFRGTRKLWFCPSCIRINW